MTTQNNTNPFEESYRKSTEPVKESTIRTMRDDLAGLASKNEIKQATVDIQPITLETPETIKPSPSPFDVYGPESKQQPTDDTESAKQKIAPKIVEIPTVPLQKETPQANNTFYKILFSIIVLAIVSISGFGYFYYTNSKKKQTVTQPKAVTDAPPTQPVNQIEETPPVEKYSSEKPNFLAFDFSQPSPDEPETQLIKLSDEIKNLSSLSSIYEFVPVDKDNNPIAFKTFATAFKINFPPTISDKLDKKISLFLYNDGGNIRPGFKIKIIPDSKMALTTELVKEEKNLVNDISFVFLNYPIENTKATFSTSFYNTNEDLVRYLNLNSEKNISLDYTITNTEVIFGTSKDTLRKIINNSNNQVQSTPNLNASSKANIPQTDSISDQTILNQTN